MKIEKINDNQIRCTLTKDDLAGRQIRLSELAYGSEKARELFKDMIRQANYEVGFNAEDIPLMVEAIPISADSIILVITKCEYPEELDTRFSRFTEPNPELLGEEYIKSQPKIPQGAADIIDLFKKSYAQHAEENSNNASTDKEIADNVNATAGAVKKEKVPTELKDFARMYRLKDISQAIRLAQVIGNTYRGESSLYRKANSEQLFLTLHKDGHSPEEFNKVCNIAAEYGSVIKYSKSLDAFYNEHGYVILKNNAIDVLSKL